MGSYGREHPSPHLWGTECNWGISGALVGTAILFSWFFID
jgi:hypothetical protein